MKKELYDMLIGTAEADKKKALLSLEVFSNTVVEGLELLSLGENAEEALRLLADADDRLNTLEKYFKNKSKRQLNG